MRTCAKCLAKLPESKFSPHRRGRDGLYHHCKSCMRRATAVYYENHPERARAAAASWKNRNRERDCATRKAWREANPAIRNATQGRRKAAKLRATPPWVDHEAINFVYRQAAAHDMTVDHIHPLQHPRLCGLHVPWNLQLLSREENSAKGNRTFPLELATTSCLVS
jgi:5-methylcytosine-specific restriction endonuclease McrA